MGNTIVVISSEDYQNKTKSVLSVHETMDPTNKRENIITN
jgi:hypothetical protein